MARPSNSALRSAILDVFDEQPICSINDIVNRLEIKYPAARRYIKDMVKAGVLAEIHSGTINNQKFYTKTIFSNVTRFANFDGANVSLKEFIHELVNLEEHKASKVIDPVALNAIKHWMLDILGSAIPEAYGSKGKLAPNSEQLARKIDGTLSMLSQMHAYLRNFRNTQIWSPVAKEKLAREFSTVAIEEHAAIVDRTWLNDGKQSE